jgi:hypothetical protein
MPPPEESPRRRHRFRGLLLKLGVFLLLGVVVNVAVAWGLALPPTPRYRGPAKDDSDRCRNDDGIIISGTVYREVGSNWIGIINFVDAKLSVQDRGDSLPAFIARQPAYARQHLTSLCSSIQPLRPQESRAVAVVARGWPMCSLYSTEEIDSRVTQAHSRAGVIDRGAIVIPLLTRISGFAPSRAIGFPYIPLWPGFAINTIFYAAMLWLLWITPGKIRRFIRIRRHRCPACGYQIAPGTAAASGGPCSECGHLLTR